MAPDGIRPEQHAPEGAPVPAAGGTIPAAGGTIPDAGSRARGRPRRDALDLEVLVATTDLLREVGARGTTIDAIAERSGCSKSTIYRRWPTRDSIVLDALRLAARAGPDDIAEVVKLERELGSTIHAAAQRGAAIFDSRIMRAVLPMMTRELLADTPIGAAFRRDVFAPIRAAAKVRLRNAVERGEISPDVDGDLVFDLIYGAMFYRLLVGSPVNAEVAHTVADMVMRGSSGPAWPARSSAAPPGG